MAVGVRRGLLFPPPLLLLFLKSQVDATVVWKEEHSLQSFPE